MWVLALSSALVGFVHSLAPGHWLPVVLMAKSRKWSDKQAALGAFVAALGHILVSVSLGVVSALLGRQLFEPYLHELEEKAGLILVVFGVVYAIYSRFQHKDCHGHEHHGPEPEKNEKAPYLFLFSLGLSPCFAVLPVFIAAIGMGSATLMFVMLTFSLGVLAALMGGSMLVSKGLVKLDHPVFEHHGDVITGVGVALLGVILLLSPHHHV